MIDLTKAPTTPRAEWDLYFKMECDHVNALRRAMQDELARSRRLLAEASRLLGLTDNSDLTIGGALT